MDVMPSRPATDVWNPLVPSIFHEPWWLDIVSQNGWQEVEVRNKNRVVGRLPYVLKRRGPFLVGGAPALAHVMGPAVDEGSGSVNTRMLDRFAIMKELAEKLPAVGFFSQVCHRHIFELMGFQKCGFDTSVHFTLEIQPAAEDVLWSGLRDKTRNVMRRFVENGYVEELSDPHRFRDFYRDNLGGQPSYFDLDLLPPLYEACSQRDQGRMLMACDRNRRPNAAIFYVWDATRLYYFLSTRDRKGTENNGAVSQLLWQAIQEARIRGLVFDFDGVASEGSARFYAGFGGTIVSRYAIRRATPAYAAMESTLALMRGGHRKNHFTQP